MNKTLYDRINIIYNIAKKTSLKKKPNPEDTKFDLLQGGPKILPI